MNLGWAAPAYFCYSYPYGHQYSEVKKIISFELMRNEMARALFQIRPDPKLFGLKDPDPKIFISDPVAPLFHNKL